MTYSSASGGEGTTSSGGGGGGQGGATTTSHHHHQRVVKHKRRYCKTPGCTRIVKSQGLCQRHGAVAKKCRVEGCPKQAQGNFNRMCKSHFKEFQTNGGQEPASVVVTTNGRSSARSNNPKNAAQEVAPMAARSSQAGAEAATVRAAAAAPAAVKPVSVYEAILPNSVGWTPGSTTPQQQAEDDDQMPLVRHLREGFDSGKPPGWHRREERQARGAPPVPAIDADLEDWERELAWTEILVLSGGPDEGYAHLARAWGRDDGFPAFLSQFVGGGPAAARAAAAAAGDHRQSARNHHHGSTATGTIGQQQHHHLMPPSSPRQLHHQRALSMDLWMLQGGGGGDPLGADSFDFSGEFLFEDLESLASGGEDDDDENENTADSQEEEEGGEEAAILCEPCNNQAAV